MNEIDKPVKYDKNWLIWDDIVLENMDIMDCDDTVNGICLINKNLHECINICKNNSECGFGYHIKTDKGEQICVPVRTSIQKYLNPSYMFMHKDNLKKLSNSKISTFLNTDVFEFPPDEGNAVMYNDIMSIINKDSGFILGVEEYEESGVGTALMSKGNYEDNIQFISSDSNIEKISGIRPIRYGENFSIHIPGTSLRLEVGDNDQLMWKTSPLQLERENRTFKAIPVDKKKKIGDKIAYGDDISFIYSGHSIIKYEPIDSSLYLAYDTAEDIGNSIIFNLKSKMKGYYCDNGKCNDVNISDIETDGEKGRYKGSIVLREKFCWGLCSTQIKKKSNVFKLLLIITGIIIIIITVKMIWKKVR